MAKLLLLQQVNIFLLPSLYKGNDSISNQKYSLLMIVICSLEFQTPGLFKYQQIFACIYDVQELYRLPPSITFLSSI